MARSSSVGGVSRLLVCVLAMAGAPLTASQPERPSPATIVSAFVWDAANKPVPDITVALRNLRTARLDRTMISDADGHVSVRGIGSSTYVLEVVNARGAVIATGQVFSIATGERVATFVRLGSKSPWFAGIFNHAGAIAVATAAGLGATAVGTTGQPQSPGR